MKTHFLPIYLLFLLLAFTTNAQSNFVGSGISLKFNGNSKDDVNLGDVYNTLNFPMTFEAWIDQNAYHTTLSGLFATDNSTGNYYGLYINVWSSGQLRTEFGDGQGAGYQYRRGVNAQSVLPLHQWIHVAIVYNSVTDIKMYYNGVAQRTVPTDGGSSMRSLTHSSDYASIGRYVTQFESAPFDGEMDEIRLWNVARSEDDIRNDMCRKLTGSEPGLIGYWTADESYTSSTVLDLTTTSENGTIEGSVDKVTSGAAIGDESINMYTSDWDGVVLALRSPELDRLKVKNISNNPYGVQVYRVDAAPYLTNNLVAYPNFYFGVFTADNTSPANYSAAYLYSFEDGIATLQNQSDLTLYSRADGSVDSWSDLNAFRTDDLQRLKQIDLSGRNEYILNLPSGKPNDKADINSEISVTASPDPFSDHMIIGNIQHQWKQITICDCSGRSIYSIDPKQVNAELSIVTSQWHAGSYFIVVNTGTEIKSQQLILQR